MELVKQNLKYLHIAIFKCESDWAYAMHMKQLASSLTGKSQSQAVKKDGRTNANRLRIHFLRRFDRAAQWARRLETVGREALDTQSQFELEAYTSQIVANHLMEKQNHQEALDHLLKAKVIYNEIAQHKDTLEALIYKEKVGQIDTFIRSCAMSLQINNVESIQFNEAAAIEKSIRSAHQQLKTE